MKVLVIGGGGREHAIVWKLAQSLRIKKLFCAPGNAGTARLAENVAIEADDISALLQFAKKEKIDFTVVGPEGPLVKGIVDLFTENGLSIFGPSRAASQLEGSKIFMKRMLVKAGVPTAEHHVFTDVSSALEHLAKAKFPLVIKADGLAAGKGVLVTADKAEAREFISRSMSGKSFGESGQKIIVEQFLDGEEASYIVASDGTNYLPLASAQDHKRAFDGDAGPNTGGMGAYSPAPVVTSELDAKIR
ncbi:MAG: phosphoribosylamine--glycine ligase, partial [Nitrospinae bacterium]|nr:phosphoribosylamine--glycine ligase [Nitrospinota bacterium]